MTRDATTVPVTFREAFRFWLKLGFISFGGPAGQIAVMHAELVEKKRWISESRFLHALNYCMLLPGPEAQQLATYAGWLLHGAIGGITAGALFVIPSIFILWGLSYIYAEFGNVFWVSSVFYGLKGAVTAIVAAAVLRIGRRALKNEVMWIVAAAAFIAIFFFRVPFPLIILSAAGIGLIGGRLFPGRFLPAGEHEPGTIANGAPEDSGSRARPSWRRSLQVLIVCVALWWLPVLALRSWLGPGHAVVKQGVFFSKAAMVTFGGAYAVLPYVAQQAVEHYRWLAPGQMMDGLGLAETTPGPLIMVVQFVGFLGGWNHPGDLSRFTAATLGAFMATWVTFLPCFLWIFLGAPYMERLRSSTVLTSALSTVTAAVVGVVLNLAAWFSIHTMVPSIHSVDWFLAALSIAVFTLMVRWKWDIIPVILCSAAAGLLYKMIF